MMINDEYDYLFKIILIGDSSVGKSSILAKFIRSDNPISDMKSTIGVEFATKSLNINDKISKLQVWDTAGQERYRAITSAYYRGAVAAILVYDISNRESFNNVRKWICELKDNTDKNIAIILVGNKCDLIEKREVSEIEGVSIAKELKIGFIETSALQLNNIDIVFETIANAVYNTIIVPKEKSDRAIFIDAPSIRINTEIPKNKKKCC